MDAEVTNGSSNLVRRPRSANYAVRLQLLVDYRCLEGSTKCSNLTVSARQMIESLDPNSPETLLICSNSSINR